MKELLIIYAREIYLPSRKWRPQAKKSYDQPRKLI